MCDRVLLDYPEIIYSVSLTTREPRGSEVDGEDYHFVSEEGFRARLERGDFLEHAIVHGHRYGTLKTTIDEAFSEGLSVVLDIDVAGAAQLREAVRKLPSTDPLRQGFVDVFVLPPSLEALKERLEKRGLDAPEIIAHRLANAQVEMQSANSFKYRVRNDNLDHAYRELCAIIEMEATGEASPRRDFA